MHVLELSNYTLMPCGSGCGISNFYFTLCPGNVYAIDTPEPDDAHLFLKGLATLIRPLNGTYRFHGRLMNFDDYKDLLVCKRKIGYVAPDAALVSNLTLRQNLLLTRYYYENALNIDLDEKTRSLCQRFAITNKLDLRAATLNAMELQVAIVIREISKKPDVLLLDQPEDFIGHAKYEQLLSIFKELITSRIPVVLLSFDRRIVRSFANHRILITNGSLTTLPMKRNKNGEG